MKIRQAKKIIKKSTPILLEYKGYPLGFTTRAHYTKLQLDKATQVTDKLYKRKEKVIREKMTEYIKEYLATHCIIGQIMPEKRGREGQRLSV